MLNAVVQHELRLQKRTPKMRYAGNEPFEAWQARARARVIDALGLPFEKCGDQLRIEYARDMGDFTETRLFFHTEADSEAVAHLWTPKGAEKPPVVICLQGHSTGMHISMGRPIYPGDEETVSGGDRDFAVQAVKRGYAAFVLEQRAFGERGGNPENVCDGCYRPAMTALILGRTLLGERVWDVSRAIDLLEARFPQVDASRVCVMGNSGGGTVSLYAAICDERVSAVMPSCAFSGFQESIGVIGHCSCNYVPGIARDFDMGDLAGLIAPRPLALVSGEKDDIFPIGAAKRAYAICESLYERAGAKGMCRHVVGPEGHRFYASLGWPALEAIWREDK